MSSCDVVLGPYSSTLMRAAAAALPDDGALLWNHGGAADDVQRSRPGRIISVLTPSRRYGEPFLRHLSRLAGIERLLILRGDGGFARQVAAGTEALARARGMQVDSLLAASDSSVQPSGAGGAEKRLALLCVGSFEEDVRTLRLARSWGDPPAVICAVAAGVREFGRATRDPLGIYGIAQWLPGRARTSDVGPIEEQFIRTYRQLAGSLPDYPASQAVAAAALALHCVEACGSTDPAAVWKTAIQTRARTFFGDFAIDGESGEQAAHETVLTVWRREGLSPAE
jgi:ABC-type branched-subunit amino acid transport system substrate-binding protein